MKNRLLFQYGILVSCLLFLSCTISDIYDPCSITGKITDTSGKVLPDVTIHFTSEYGEKDVTTSSDGTYKISISGGSPVTITFSKEQYRPETTKLVVKGGERKTLDIKLLTLAEDAYLNLKQKVISVSHVGGTFSAGIATNVTYQYQCDATWITCNKVGQELYVKCDTNQVAEERSAIIILKAEYNLTDTIKIKQLAGPVLRITNSKDVPDPKAFVTFNREIDVVSATSTDANLKFELSADKKTVYFSNYKIYMFSTLPVRLTVRTSDNVEWNYNLTLKLYVKSVSMPVNNGQHMYFTSDNKYAWIFTIGSNQSSLRQFSTVDFSEANQIIDNTISFVTYNPYNNSLYTISSVSSSGKSISEIKIYDAVTGQYKNKFTIDYNGETVSKMEFTDNGYGVMLIGKTLFYFDSSNNHSWGIYPESSKIIDSGTQASIPVTDIRVFNNNKTILIYAKGKYTNSDYCAFTIDSNTKTLKPIINNFWDYSIISTTNSFTGVAYLSNYAGKVFYQDVFTLSKTTFDFGYSNNSIEDIAILSSDNSLPCILTSNMWIISLNNKSILYLAHNTYCSSIKSSNDGKFVLVNNSDVVYLFNSDIFTKNYSCINY